MEVNKGGKVEVSEGRCGLESCSFDDDGKSCRLCFETGDTCDWKNPLVSPCSCSGTSKWVHLECLKKWQKICSKRNDARAWVCSVCRSPYSIKPTPLGVVAKLRAVLQKAWEVCANLALLAFFSQVFPSSHGSVALFVLAALYSFVYINPAVTFTVISLRLLTMLVFSVAPQTQVQLIWQVSTRTAGGGPLGLALVRYGENVPGLGLGSLLVASRELDGSIFERSVVFIYEYDRRNGAQGVILNKDQSVGSSTPFGLDPNEWGGRRPCPSWSASVSRYIGGPVGLPSHDQMSSSAFSSWGGELVALHRLFDETGEEEEEEEEEEQQQQRHQLLGAKVGIQTTSSGENTTSSVMYSSGPGLHAFLDGLQDHDMIQRDKLRLYHGRASWAGGQLEGEVRAQAWAFCNATISDLFETPTELLWDSLVNSDRLNGISY